MHLAELTRPELIFPALRTRDARELLRFLCQKLVEEGVTEDAEVVFSGLLEREELGSTGIGGGIAFPHCRLAGLPEVVLAIGIHEQGVDFAALDGEPVNFFFLVVSPEKEPAAHLQCLSAISRWVGSDGVLERLRAVRQPEEIHQLLLAET